MLINFYFIIGLLAFLSFLSTSKGNCVVSIYSSTFLVMACSKSSLSSSSTTAPAYNSSFSRRLTITSSLRTSGFRTSSLITAEPSSSCNCSLSRLLICSISSVDNSSVVAWAVSCYYSSVDELAWSCCEVSLLDYSLLVSL